MSDVPPVDPPEKGADQPGIGSPGTVVTGPEPGSGTGVFDAFHPPSADRIDDCVHCGFCLPTCPTYALWGEEMDSPRGRIYLMKVGREGTVEMDDTFVGHFDACLGCMACVTACPSGVAYNELIEDTRAQIERNHSRSLADRTFRRLIFALFPYPARLRLAAVFGWLFQLLRLNRVAARAGWLPARLQALISLMPDVSLREVWRRTPARTPAHGPSRLRVGLLTGCVQSVFFARVNAATVRVLAAEGCEVIAPPAQGCCGALGVHAGQAGQATAFARATIDTFTAAEVDVVVTNAAGCGSTMKEYGHLLRDDPVYAGRARALAARVRDISEVLADLEPRAPRQPLDAAVAYHDACHLAHAQGVRAQPRALLAAIPGLRLLEPAEPEICCGSAGIYNLVEPEAAADLGQRKVANLAATTPDAIATGNPGCMLQVRRHLPDVPVLHPVELIDASIRGVNPVPAPPRH